LHKENKITVPIEWIYLPRILKYGDVGFGNFAWNLMLHTVSMETEVNVTYRLTGMSLSPAKKEIIVIFFNHFVAAFMLSVLSPSRCSLSVYNH